MGGLRDVWVVYGCLGGLGRFGWLEGGIGGLIEVLGGLREVWNGSREVWVV